MPRHPKHLASQLSTFQELRNLRLAVQVRAEQVKLRRLEWDTQTLALPHITPMPGDGELQIRQPMTQGDFPAPRPPVERPEFEAGMPHDFYQLMMDLYLDELREERDRDPYNKLASISAQTTRVAKQDRARERRERARERERAQRSKACTDQTRPDIN